MSKKGIIGGIVVIGVIALILGGLNWVRHGKPSFDQTKAFNLFSPTAVQSTPAIPIHPASGTEGRVTVNGKDISLSANSLGSFPRVTVPENAVISIHLTVAPHTEVQQTALDGGIFSNKANSQVGQTDDQGNFDFQYQIRREPGNYRVAVNYQGQRLLFNFWVGPPLTPRVP